jgi:hypothetical protein
VSRPANESLDRITEILAGVAPLWRVPRVARDSRNSRTSRLPVRILFSMKDSLSGCYTAAVSGLYPTHCPKRCLPHAPTVNVMPPEARCRPPHRRRGGEPLQALLFHRAGFHGLIPRSRVPKAAPVRRLMARHTPHAADTRCPSRTARSRYW